MESSSFLQWTWVEIRRGLRGGPYSAQATTSGSLSPQLRLHRFTATKQQGLKIREEEKEGTFISKHMSDFISSASTLCHWLMQAPFIPFLSPASAELKGSFWLKASLLASIHSGKYPLPLRGERKVWAVD